jgi:hypothetical protein
MTMVPDRLLVHDVVLVEPVIAADAYNDQTYDYSNGTRTDIKAWLQQDQRLEQFRDGRDPLDERWLLVTNHETVSGHARIEWAGHPAGTVTFSVDGPTEPAYTPAGFHHLEAQLRIVSG